MLFLKFGPSEQPGNSERTKRRSLTLGYSSVAPNRG